MRIEGELDEYEIPDDRPLSPDEFKDIMERIHNNRDGYAESWHEDMDMIMDILLEMLGYEEGIDIFRHTPKWYS